MRLSKQYLDLGIRDHAIDKHAIRLNKRCVNNLEKQEGIIYLDSLS